MKLRTKNRQEGPVATAIRMAQDLAARAGEVLGLVEEFDREQVAAFKAAQAEAVTIPERLEAVRAAAARLTAAKEALATGRLFEGGDARHAVQHLDHLLAVAGGDLRRAQKAATECVGLCPCQTLQAKRRDLLESRSATLQRISQLKRSRETVVDEIRRGEADLTRDWHPDELASVARRLREDKTQLARIDDELAALEADRLQFDADLDSVRDAMRKFKV